MIKAGVIGHPISHSLSPNIHGFWLKQYGIDGSYEAIDVAPENLRSFIKEGLIENNYSGINATIPHKEKIIPFLDEIDDFARKIGAVNTVIVRDGKILGKNTDAYGFIQNIKSNSDFSFDNKKAVILGAGGACRAICAGLQSEKIGEIAIVNRTIERAEAIKNQIGGNIKTENFDNLSALISDAGLLVNSTSLGMKGSDDLEIDLSNLPEDSLVTDIVYNPLETGLLKQAKERGNKIVDGIGMLLYQAVPGFEAWFGTKPEVTEELRDSVLGKI